MTESTNQTWNHPPRVVVTVTNNHHILRGCEIACYSSAVVNGRESREHTLKSWVSAQSAPHPETNHSFADHKFVVSWARLSNFRSCFILPIAPAIRRIPEENPYQQVGFQRHSFQSSEAYLLCCHSPGHLPQKMMDSKVDAILNCWRKLCPLLHYFAVS